MRVFHKSVPQESVSYKVSHKSAQECPTKVSERMYPKRVFHKSVSYKSFKNWLGVCFQVRVCIVFFFGDVFMLFVVYQVPAPSNRSPPATFKSPNILDTWQGECW